MSTPEGLRWWKSSRSSSQGGACIEVAVATDLSWRTSTRSSSQGGNCVEVAASEDLPWQTSSRSTSQGGQCVEVAGTSSTWYVRDSKDRQGPVLAVSGTAWSAFTANLRTGNLDAA